jgi:hypothetical protein
MKQQKVHTHSSPCWGDKFCIRSPESPRRLVKTVDTQWGYILLVSFVIRRWNGCARTFSTWAPVDSRCVVIVIKVMRKRPVACWGWCRLKLGSMGTFAEN